MKLLWVGHFLPWPLRGGSNIRSYHLIREAARGAEVSLLSFNQRDLLGDEQCVREAERALLEHCVRVKSLPIPAEAGRLHRERVALRSLLRGAYDEVWFSSFAMRQAIADEWHRFAPDVVHFDTVGLAQYAETVPGPGRVLNHHNVESHMMRRRAEQERRGPRKVFMALQARRLADLERRVAPWLAAHLVVSDLDRERLAAVIPAARSFVIPNGVDLEYFAPVPPTRTCRPESTIFVGGLNWYPNLKAARWFLDQVFPRVVESHPAATFTLIGRDPPGDLQQRAARDSRVRVLGEVEDIRTHVRDCAVYVCPIHDGGGTRLKILDTLAQAMPLVATRMAVEGVGVEDGVHAVLADDAAGFASAVSRLFREPAQGAALGRAGRELVSRDFSWDRIGRDLRAVYAAAAGRG